MPRSPWRRIRLASIAGELTADRTRLGSVNLRQLDTSHGCQDHTVLPYAASFTKPFSQPVPPAKLLAKAFKRRSSARCARSRKTALRTRFARLTLPRPPQPAPTFVTMANAPLPGRDGVSCKGDLGQSRTGIFLRLRLDRANHVEAVTENQFPAHVCQLPDGKNKRLYATQTSRTQASCLAMTQGGLCDVFAATGASPVLTRSIDRINLLNQRGE